MARPKIPGPLAIVLVGLAGAPGCLHEVADVAVDGDATPFETGALQYTHAANGDRSIHILDVDLCEPGIELVATGPNDGTRTVSSFARRTGALAAINGGHSWSGEVGPSAHDGMRFGTRPDGGDLGQAVFGDGFARFVAMRDTYVPQPGDDEVLTGLLTLVHDGVAQHDLLPHDSYTCSVQHPRTLLGLTEDKRHVLMVVVDGRAVSSGRRGMTCAEAADLMVFLGAHDAINLDGGGSSTMVVGGDVVNVPSDGRERSVPTHLAVVSRPGARGHCPEAPPPPPPPPPAPEGCGLLAPGDALAPGQSMVSCNGAYRLAHQHDGNVVLYRTRDGVARWHTRTHGTSTSTFAMQSDGNLVLYAPGGTARWHSRTHGNPGAHLAVQDDGNLVVFGASRALWSSNTAEAQPPAPPPPPPASSPPPSSSPPSSSPPSAPPAAAPPCGLLASGAHLLANQSVLSCDGRFRFILQGDGNVVLYELSSGAPLWHASTHGQGGNLLVMMGDGNLVLFAANWRVVWSTRSGGHPGAQLAVQDDGNVVIYDGSTPVWNTRTCCR